MRTELFDFFNTTAEVIKHTDLVQQTNDSKLYKVAVYFDIGDYRYYFYNYKLRGSLLIEKCDIVDKRKEGVFDVMIEISESSFRFYDTYTMSKCAYYDDLFTIKSEEEFFQNSTIHDYDDLEFNDLLKILDFRNNVLDNLQQYK